MKRLECPQAPDEFSIGWNVSIPAAQKAISNSIRSAIRDCTRRRPWLSASVNICSIRHPPRSNWPRDSSENGHLYRVSFKSASMLDFPIKKYSAGNAWFAFFSLWHPNSRSRFEVRTAGDVLSRISIAFRTSSATSSSVCTFLTRVVLLFFAGQFESKNFALTSQDF